MRVAHARFADVCARCPVKRLRTFVPTLSDHLVQPGGQPLQHLGITRRLVIAGQGTQGQGQQVGVLAAASLAGALHRAVTVGQHHDPASLGVQVVTEHVPVTVCGNQVPVLAGCFPGGHQQVQRPADLPEMIGIPAPFAGHTVGGHSSHVQGSPVSRQQVIVEQAAQPEMASVLQHPELVPPGGFKRSAIVITSGMPHTVCPDVTGLRLSMMVQAPDVTIYGVDDIDVHQMVGALSGSIEIPSVTGSQVLHEEAV